MKKGVTFGFSLAAAAFVFTVPAFAGVHIPAAIATVPEPTTMLLLGIGVGTVALVRRFSKK